MPVILGIDTTDRLSLASLLEDGRVVCESAAEELASAEALFGVLEDVRRAGGGKAISHVAVAIGPGSYTGIRTGLAAAQGLSLALGIPVFGISILLARALGASTRGPVIPWMRANKNEVFAAVYDIDLDHGRIDVIRTAEAVSFEIFEEWKASYAPAVPIAVELSEHAVSPSSSSLIAQATALTVSPGLDWQQSPDGLNLVPLYAKGVRASTLAERRSSDAPGFLPRGT